VGLSGEDLAEELFRRGAGRWNLTREMAAVLAHIVDRYEIELSIDSFQDGRGMVWRDLNGRSVSGYDVGTNEGYIRSETQKFTDILIVVEDGMILGWVAEDQVLDIGQPWFSLNAKALCPMPKVFDFAQQCPHLVMFGGWWNVNERAWECFGCGRSDFVHKFGASKRARVS